MDRHKCPRFMPMSVILDKRYVAELMDKTNFTEFIWLSDNDKNGVREASAKIQYLSTSARLDGFIPDPLFKTPATRWIDVYYLHLVSDADCGSTCGGTHIFLIRL